jgi:hypothetical protein
MDELSASNKRLKSARDSHMQDLDNVIAALDNRDTLLKERVQELNRKKHDIAQTHGNLDAAEDDLIEINAGGKIIVAKRSTLTQIQGSRMEALFSGRWDKKLMRDGHGRIFLDVDPTCFQAIVDYLNEMTISSKDSPPSPPSVDDEHKIILNHQLELFSFGLGPEHSFFDSTIIKDAGGCVMLHEWLEENGQDGEFSLLFRGTRDGQQTNDAFHSKCDNKGCTLTVIETTCGKVFGGYSNTAWLSTGRFKGANQAFLFALSGGGILSSCKMKLKNANDKRAVFCNNFLGPVFGDDDMYVDGSNVHIRPGNTYDQGPMPNGSFPIKEVEVFQVTKSSNANRYLHTNRNLVLHATQAVEEVTRFSDDMNKAINAKQTCLLQAESEMLQLEESFMDEQTFVDKFATGDAKDVVVLNVSGTVMTTKRCTLCAVEDSALAQQFDDSKWTEQGCNSPRVKEWTPDEVSTWAKNIDGIPKEVSVTLYENGITGKQLLALSIEGLKMIGIEQAGTVCLLLKEIEKLDKGLLIEHSPYCFDKILNHLRLMHLHSIGLIVKELSLPEVDESQKQRFEKVVKYYFPGDAAKIMLG